MWRLVVEGSVLMQIKAGVLTEHNLFVMKAEGSVGDQEMFGFQSSIKDIPDYKPTLNTLFDLGGISENLLSPESLIRFSTTTPFKPTSKRAYVISDEKASIFATIFGTTSSKSSEYFFVTYNLEDACEWLEVAFDEVMASTIYITDT